MRTAIIIAAAVLLPLWALAHSGTTFWEVPDGAYILDVGYEPGTFTAGVAARFDFDLLGEDRIPREYSQVWVRIRQENMTLLATGVIRQPLGPTTLVYVPGAGEHVLSASFRDAEGTEIAEGEFPFTVATGEAPLPWGAIFAALIGAAVGAGGAFLMRRG